MKLSEILEVVQTVFDNILVLGDDWVGGFTSVFVSSQFNVFKRDTDSAI